MRILITGGAGFIGKKLSQVLSEGHEVIIFDDLSTGNLEGLEGFEVIVGSITDYEHIEGAVLEVRPDIVIHLAGQTSVLDSIEYPGEDLLVNGQGTMNVVHACQVGNVSKIIYSSTVAVYGDVEGKVSEDSPISPCNPYGLHKYLGEEYVKSSGLDYTIFRFGNVYGSGNNKGVVEAFRKNIEYGFDLEVNGLESRRTFVHVYDIVGAIIRSFTGGSGEVYNLGNRESVAITSLAEKMVGIAGAEDRVDILVKEKNPGEIGESYVTFDKVKNELGWCPAISLEEGLKEVLL